MLECEAIGKTSPSIHTMWFCSAKLRWLKGSCLLQPFYLAAAARTKQWMHQKEYTHHFLFLPRVFAIQNLPVGLPSGLVWFECKVAWLWMNPRFESFVLLGLVSHPFAPICGASRSWSQWDFDRLQKAHWEVLTNIEATFVWPFKGSWLPAGLCWEAFGTTTIAGC